MKNQWKKRVKEHYNFVVNTMKDEDRVFGVFLIGSQNYNLATSMSDVDTKAVILPSLDEMAENAKAVSTTIYTPDSKEHITLTDFRLWTNQMFKQNINVLETLFTDYFVVNPKYEEVWVELQANREDLAHANAETFLKAVQGIFLGYKHHAFVESPTTKEEFDKFGYNPKSFMHMYRVRDFLTNYLAGNSFENCLFVKDEDKQAWLLGIKKGEMSKDKAVASAQVLEECVKDMASDAQLNAGAFHYQPFTEEMKNIVHNINYKVLKLALMEDFK